MNIKFQEDSLKSLNDLKKRILAKLSNGSQVYIIPSQSGGKFIFMNFTLLLIALSYASNMALIVTFVMITFFVLQMLLTHQIIQDIKDIKLDIKDDFANKDIIITASFPYNIKQNYHNLKLDILFENESKISTEPHNLLQDNKVQFLIPNCKRGFYKINKVCIHTDAIKSLFYVWRYFKITDQFYCYPHPKNNEQNNKFTHRVSQNTNGTLYEQHIPYIQGLNSKRIDWKVYARKESLYWKKHIDEITDSMEINYQTIKGDKEIKLSHMSYLIKQCYHNGVPWKLILPNIQIESTASYTHYKRSLEAISVY